MLLPQLAVIFAGLTGGHHERVEKQMESVVRALHVDVKPVPASVARTLTHYDATTRANVRKLHVGAVVAGEVTDKGALLIVIYDRDGNLASNMVRELTNDALTDDELAALRQDLASELEPFLGEAPAPSPAPTVDAPATQPVEDGVPDPAPPADTALADSETVSAADVEALTGGTATPVPDVETETPVSTAPELHLGASVGLGVVQRSFAPGPSAVAGYGSYPVGAVHVAVEVQPLAHVLLRLSTERTLGMTTALDDGNASTVVSRWEASGGYAIARGNIELAPEIGIGRRAFSIDSADPARTPDNSYDYIVVGARGQLRLGGHVGVGLFAAFEPVVSGTEPTEMALGEATRWAIDGGASAIVHFGHALVRATADYQRFTWTWNMAGERGEGGATDTYLTGSVSLGAEY
jgi:hypothetical protein